MPETEIIGFTLSPEQVRVLGCLLEKAVTTPDAYPLSLNSLRVACNQTTNRDPVVTYEEREVHEALDALREMGLVARSKAHGERAIKYRHLVPDVIELTAGERALLCTLLLRGAQTPGELKQRSERMHPFGAVSEIEAAMAGLAARGFVVEQARRPGQKEHRWMHLLGGSDTAVAVVAPTPGSSTAPSSVSGAPSPAPSPAGSRPEAVHTSSVVTTPHSVGHALELRNPATGEVLETIDTTDDAEIAAKLRRARVAQRAWSARPLGERIAIITRWRDLFVDQIEQCAQITMRETGKPIANARGELRAVPYDIDDFIAQVPEVVAARDVGTDEGVEQRETYEPYGVVAHISAWDYPYLVALSTIVPALLCGNAVLYKPSELATRSGLKLVDLAHRAGIPVDVLQAIVGDGVTGAALVASGVDLVTCSASYDTGRAVARAAAERLVPVVLELGGKDAAYVCDDADIDVAAIAAAKGAFYTAGQGASAIERIYVHAGVWAAFLDAFATASHAWVLGDPADDATTVGALTRPGQRELLEAQLADARAKGARVLFGGEAREGNWFEPTALVDVDHSMVVMRDESCGPIVGVMRVRDDAEAIALMDETDYGLTAAVFSASRARAEAILARLDVGSAYWNCADRTTATMAWSGRRHSGLGVSMAPAGIASFVRPKAWHLSP